MALSPARSAERCERSAHRAPRLQFGEPLDVGLELLRYVGVFALLGEQHIVLGAQLAHGAHEVGSEIVGHAARARITGESAVALSQHGTVAPVTIHHRVDFAASMIDGRTVGEVVPNSQSAKEISDLWLYIQDKLSRIVHDPALLPQVKPDHLALNALLSPGPEVAVELPPELPVYEGPERRSGIERRVILEPRSNERRVFGRRATDVPQWGIK